MTIKGSMVIAALILVYCVGPSVSGQVSGGAYRDDQENIVLAATVGEGDFKPFETRMLSKGTWEVRAIKGEIAPEKRWAWTSFHTISNDWAGTDCNGHSRGWVTTFYVSVVGMENINNRWSKQFPSARCPTQALAIENAKGKVWTIKLEGNSAVTFFLGAFYDVPKLPLGGGLTLSLKKRQQQQQQQRQRRRT